MRRIALFTLSFLIVSHCIAAEAGTRRRAAAHPSNLTWTVEITTTGGFSGQGVGSVMIHASGAIAATDLSTKSCSSRLSQGDLLTLNQAIQHSNPAEWNHCYVKASNPTGCCDQVQYRLTFKDLDAAHREKTFMTFWYDQNSEALPADLGRLFNAAWEIRRRTLEGCR